MRNLNVRTFQVISFLTITALAIVILYNKNKIDSLTNSNNELSQKNKINFSILEEQFAIQEINAIIHSKGIENINLTSREGEKYFLFNIDLYNKHVVFFDAEMCSICIDKEFENLEILADMFGKENIVIIMSGFKKQYVFRDRKLYGWKNLFHTSEELYTMGHLSNSPIFSYFNTMNNIMFLSCMSKTHNRTFHTYLKLSNEFKN
ncbi:hypothetical protein [Carboxylicivirga sp. N1Y90]|uniref:hypothetical protein n=1 Tax=Carboxylicivirga fragile TaxID=3417571 RepID=UPI003D33C6A9|nr:hypothetical protein [Marinilabiliaceae bacterium N1Y90]